LTQSHAARARVLDLPRADPLQIALMLQGFFTLSRGDE
jgi:hypothetical protein